jgi:hypothetical protein
MESNQMNSRLISLKEVNKDRQIVLRFIRNEVEKATGKTFEQVLIEYSEIKRYQMALFCITTSNKAVCESMCIPVEAGTRYKEKLEELGLLVTSTDLYVCPFTKEPGVQFLSTNPKEFERLKKSSDTQLKLFSHE